VDSDCAWLRSRIANTIQHEPDNAALLADLRARFGVARAVDKCVSALSVLPAAQRRQVLDQLATRARVS
jgi:hypothetical protein